VVAAGDKIWASEAERGFRVFGGGGLEGRFPSPGSVGALRAGLGAVLGAGTSSSAVAERRGSSRRCSRQATAAAAAAAAAVLPRASCLPPFFARLTALLDLARLRAAFFGVTSSSSTAAARVAVAAAAAAARPARCVGASRSRVRLAESDRRGFRLLATASTASSPPPPPPRLVPRGFLRGDRPALAAPPPPPPPLPPPPPPPSPPPRALASKNLRLASPSLASQNRDCCCCLDSPSVPEDESASGTATEGRWGCGDQIVDGTSPYTSSYLRYRDE
jgi:hypothetical protein